MRRRFAAVLVLPHIPYHHAKSHKITFSLISPYSQHFIFSLLPIFSPQVIPPPYSVSLPSAEKSESSLGKIHLSILLYKTLKNSLSVARKLSHNFWQGAGFESCSVPFLFSSCLSHFFFRFRVCLFAYLFCC